MQRRKVAYGSPPANYEPPVERDDLRVPEWAEPPHADEAGEFSLGPGDPVGEYTGIAPPSYGSAASGRS